MSYERRKDPEFGKWLRAIREAGGLSQEEIAEETRRQGAQLEASSLAHWEQGNILKNYDTIPALAAALGVTIDELLRVHLTAEGYKRWPFEQIPQPRYGPAFAAKVREQMRKMGRW